MVTRIIYRKTDVTRKYPDIYFVRYNVNSYYKTLGVIGVAEHATM